MIHFKKEGETTAKILLYYVCFADMLNAHKNIICDILPSSCKDFIHMNSLMWFRIVKNKY